VTGAAPTPDFAEFRRLAGLAFDALPPEFREGIDGLEVSPETVPHASLPDVYTLGECRTENFPSEYGGVGDVRSLVVLYFGSFLALSRLDPEWDWEGEIWETVTHEVRHHLESLADDDALEQTDYALDQNFARREGDAFDPFFYRAGTPAGRGCWVVDGDTFLEVTVAGDRRPSPPVLALDAVEYPVRVPAELGDVHFVLLDEAEEGGEVVAVFVRQLPFGERIASLLRPRARAGRETGWSV
jgi:predicted Zn-dependent protease with MMP-like domain